MDKKEIEKLLDMFDETQDSLDYLVFIRLSDIKELIELKRLVTTR